MWPWLLAAVILVVVGAAGFLFMRRRSGGGKMVSMVLLLREPRQIGAQQVRRAATKAFGVRIGSTVEEENFVVQHTPEAIPVRINGLMLGFITANVRYTETPDAVLEGMDPRLADVLRHHQAWISVDAMDGMPRQLRQAVYQHIGRLLAEFVDDNVLGVYSTEETRLMWTTPDLTAKLRSDNPLDAVRMDAVPIAMVKADDPRLAAAVQEARQRWPEFVRAYETRKPKQMFAVKACFTEDDQNEFMWLQVSGISPTTVTGRLDNSPNIVKNVKEGDTITVNHDDIQDWIYDENGQMMGGFSVKVLSGKA